MTKITIDLNERDLSRLEHHAKNQGFSNLEEFALGLVQAQMRRIELNREELRRMWEARDQEAYVLQKRKEEAYAREQANFFRRWFRRFSTRSY